MHRIYFPRGSSRRRLGCRLRPLYRACLLAGVSLSMFHATSLIPGHSLQTPVISKTNSVRCTQPIRKVPDRNDANPSQSSPFVAFLFPPLLHDHSIPYTVMTSTNTIPLLRVAFRVTAVALECALLSRCFSCVTRLLGTVGVSSSALTSVDIEHAVIAQLAETNAYKLSFVRPVHFRLMARIR